MKIIVEYNPKPIPDRRYDWDAWDEDDPDRGVECGPTPADALRAWADMIEE